jgi:ribonuclease Z
VTTEVILIATGVPHPRPGRADPACWSATVTSRCSSMPPAPPSLRLMEAGTPPHALSAVFLTHVHSDHVVGLPDIAMTRWIQRQLVRTGPLVVVAPRRRLRAASPWART